MPTDQKIKARLLKSRATVEAIRQEQTERVNAFRGQGGPMPKLAIIQIKDDPVISTYVAAKKRYGETIGAETVIYRIDQSDARKIIATLNDDDSVHGMIVQLPITNPAQTEEILESVALSKDVDGLRHNSPFTPATPLAIMRLLEYYEIDFARRQVVIVGRGALVGTPLLKLLKNRGIEYDSLDKNTRNNTERLQQADLIITATGQPGLIRAENIKPKAVVVDAGTATAGGKTVGDVEDEAYQRTDISITPRRGGVGPLTVCSLFDNLLKAYQDQQP